MKLRNLITVCVALLLALCSAPLLAQAKDHRDIKFPELPKFEIPQPQKQTLSNGMQIFLIEDHELPLINVVARIRTGSNYEPADKVGLANILGQVMREGGTTLMTGDAMDDYLEARAASVETWMTGDFGGASMNCLKEDFDDVLGVFVDVLRNPAFSEDKIQLAKQQAKAGIARRNDDISGIAAREFRRLIHGADSPLARNLEYATLAAITRDDLVAWHGRYYHPNNIMVGIVGDFDSAAMKTKLEAAFKDWNSGPNAELPQITVAEPKPGLHFVEKSDVTQAYVMLGHRGIRTDNPDYYAVQVMNEIFGGGFSARLFSVVRSEKGLAYSVRGGIGSGFIREGLFSTMLSTKSETMAASIDALRIEIDRIIAAPPTEAEMKRARESILNSFVFNSTSMGQILSQQMNYAYYGYPADFLVRYRSGIEKVTTADVARVAKKYIHPDQLVTLVVGKAADFDRPVSDFGSVNVVDISIPAPDSSAPVIARSPAALAAGKDLLGRAAKAILGSSGAAQSIDGDYTIALNMGGQKMALGQLVTIALPDKVRQTFKTPMGDQTVVINGERGVVLAGGQTQPFPASQIADQLKDLNRQILFLAGRVDEVDAVAGAEREVDGATCLLVVVSLDEVESTLCIDEAGSVLSQSYQGDHPMQGTPGEIEIRFSDYRDVGGYMLPFTQALTFDGEEFAMVTANSIAVNSELDSTAFDIPE